MAKKKATRRKITTKKVNKARAIKDYMASHPQASPAEVAAELSKQGIEVTANYASNVKSIKKKATKKKRGSTKKKITTEKAAEEATPFENVKEAGLLMYQALDLVLKAGVKEARSMVDIADKMINRISDEEEEVGHHASSAQFQTPI